MDNRWFKEDREKYKGSELRTQVEASEKALKNSTLLARRLSRILQEEIEKTYLTEEAYEGEAWERKVLGASAERKALRRVQTLINFED